MLQNIHSQDFALADSVLADADPETAALVQALEGCCHPKAGRLLARLAAHPDAEARAVLRADVLQLLTLAFGRAEALRRLQ
jgi:hypothetical protein